MQGGQDMTVILSWVLLAVLGIPALYLCSFAIASKLFRTDHAGHGSGNRRFITLIPAYKSDSCIVESAVSASGQDYPSSNYRVLVISDSMKAETVSVLRDKGIEVLEVSFENSSKAESLKSAVSYLGENAADIAVILDADNIVGKDFLSGLDDYFESGSSVVQAHRTAKNIDTPIAVLDAAAEEINNSIFRKGHVALGLSSALIGSGMAFPYEWFSRNVKYFNTAAEDKEMEIALLTDGLRVDYADDIHVLDEKTRTKDNYARQHRRWIGSQYNMLGTAFRSLPSAKLKFGMIDKIFQWLLPPRLAVLALLPLCAIVFSILKTGNAVLWWLAVVLILAAFILGLPAAMWNSCLVKSLFRLPSLALTSILNIFHLKGTKKNFIHTEHI